MPVGMEVGLGPGHTVLDGDPAPPPKKGAGHTPNFGPCLLWPNGWMDQDVTWSNCVRCGPSSPPKRGTTAPPIFGPFLLLSNGLSYQQLQFATELPCHQ